MMQFLPLPMIAAADQGESLVMPNTSKSLEKAAHQFDFESYFDAGLAKSVSPEAAQSAEVDAAKESVEVDAAKEEVAIDDLAEIRPEAELEPDQSVASANAPNDTREAQWGQQAAFSGEALAPDAGRSFAMEMPHNTFVQPAVDGRVTASRPVDVNDPADRSAFQNLAGAKAQEPGNRTSKTAATKENSGGKVLPPLAAHVALLDAAKIPPLESSVGSLDMGLPSPDMGAPPLHKLAPWVASAAIPHTKSEAQISGKAAPAHMRSAPISTEPHLGTSQRLDVGAQAVADRGFEAAKLQNQAVTWAGDSHFPKTIPQAPRALLNSEASNRTAPDALMRSGTIESSAQAFQGMQKFQQSDAAYKSVTKGLVHDALDRLPVRQSRETQDLPLIHPLPSSDSELSQQIRPPQIAAAKAPDFPAQAGLEQKLLMGDKSKTRLPSGDEAIRAVEPFDTSVVRGAAPQGGVLSAPATLSEARAVLIVREAMAEMRANGQSEIELTLSPKELGKLRFVMSPNEGQMSVQVFAERQETLDAMRRHVETYAAALTAEGFGSAQFEFGRDANGSSEGSEARGPGAGTEADIQSEDVASQTVLEAARVVWLGSNKQLDIRL